MPPRVPPSACTPCSPLPEFAPRLRRSPAAVPSPAVTAAMLTVELIRSPLPLQFLRVHWETARS